MNVFLNLQRLVEPVSIGPGIMKSGTDGRPLARGIREARGRLIGMLDSAAAANPANLWVASQRVRYLAEDGRLKDAVAAALACKFAL